MICQELVETVSAYLDGTLAIADRTRLQAHLELCEPCVRYVDQFRVTIERSGQVHAEDLSPQEQNELLTMFRHWNAA
jgi:anti-sigma factor RsiW